MATNSLRDGRSTRSLGARAGGLAVALVLVAALSSIATVAPALAVSVKKEFSVFNDCPVNNPVTIGCVYSTTTAGEFKLGSKSVPITSTIILQGGDERESSVLVPAEGGETLSAVPLKVPGGLVGIEFPGNFTEVTATAEPAGTIEISPENLGKESGSAVVLPVKIKLSNTILGSSCYTGSDSEPITIHLTTGTTDPPKGTAPLTGSKGTLNLFRGAGKIVEISGTKLVDNTFPAPGVQGCGGLLSLIVDPLVDIEAGLPAGAGKNAAILQSKLEVANVGYVKAERTLPEIGRCVLAPSHKEGHTVVREGTYENATCTEEIPYKDAKYEWKPGPGESPSFTTSGKAVTLETVAGAKVKCTESSGSGEYTGTKTATLGVTLTGCENEASKQACESSGAGEGEIVADGLHASLGFIRDVVLELDNETVAVGWSLAGGSTLIDGQCAGGTQGLVVTGSVIGTVASVDKMAPSNTLRFEGKGGVQVPQSFEEEPKDTLTATIGSQGAQAAGLTDIVKVANAERLEFKAVDE